MTRIQPAPSRQRSGAAHLAIALLAGGTLAGTLAGGAGPAAASAVRASAVRATAVRASADRAAAAPACDRWSVVRPPDPALALDDLFGVAVLSARNIWAVGDDAAADNAGAPYKSLIVHWNGQSWKKVPSPSPGIGSTYLTSVTAVSSSNIWAAGDYSTQSGDFASNKTLMLHWNGRAWRQVKTPSPGSFANDLSTVRRVSANSVWAVGADAGSNFHDKSLILHWNGRAWSTVRSPNPGKLNNSLGGLAVVSAKSIWTTEDYSNSSGTPGTSAIVHWNGRTWSKAAAAPAGSDLIDVTASSARNAWAVGGDKKGLSMALHWNGRAWTRVPTPNVEPGKLINSLESVTAVSPTSAWAVGVAQNVFSVFEGTAMEMHWNGRKWSRMKSPAPGANSALFGIQATSAVSPWAVGEYGNSDTVQRTLVFRCR
jgi:hypothetical protein